VQERGKTIPSVSLTDAKNLSSGLIPYLKMTRSSRAYSRMKMKLHSPFPDISAELPGVELESEERDFTPITDQPEEDFRDLAEAALHNAGIDANQRIRAALDAGTGQQAPAVIEPENIEIVYEVTFDLPDAGLPMANDPNLILGDQHDNTIIPAFVADHSCLRCR
jgi:hypothetical protein